MAHVTCAPLLSNKWRHHPRRQTQEVARLFGRHPNVTLVPGALPPAAYSAALRSARFCLAPYGHGWGVRLGQAVAAGCVPVIVQVGRRQVLCAVVVKLH